MWSCTALSLARSVSQCCISTQTNHFVLSGILQSLVLCLFSLFGVIPPLALEISLHASIHEKNQLLLSYLLTSFDSFGGNGFFRSYGHGFIDGFPSLPSPADKYSDEYEEQNTCYNCHHYHRREIFIIFW